MLLGFAGHIPHVDLSSGPLDVEQPGEAFHRRYVGGGAPAVNHALRLTPPRTDPFAPENRLALATGPANGTPISSQSRMMAVAKSPLTGTN